MVRDGGEVGLEGLQKRLSGMLLLLLERSYIDGVTFVRVWRIWFTDECFLFFGYD